MVCVYVCSQDFPIADFLASMFTFTFYYLIIIYIQVYKDIDNMTVKDIGS